MLAEFITPKDVIDGNLKGVIVELENELTIAQAAALYVVGQFKEVLLQCSIRSLHLRTRSVSVRGRGWIAGGSQDEVATKSHAAVGASSVLSFDHHLAQTGLGAAGLCHWTHVSRCSSSAAVPRCESPSPACIQLTRPSHPAAPSVHTAVRDDGLVIMHQSSE